MAGITKTSNLQLVCSVIAKVKERRLYRASCNEDGLTALRALTPKAFLVIVEKELHRGTLTPAEFRAQSAAEGIVRWLLFMAHNALVSGEIPEPFREESCFKILLEIVREHHQFYCRGGVWVQDDKGQE